VRGTNHTHRGWIATAATALCALVLGTAAADAATFRATKTADDGPRSLRAAVEKANDRAGDDTVVLRPRRGQGTVFTLRRCGDAATQEDLNAGGDLDHTDAVGKLTIIGRGKTIRTTCDGERLIHDAASGGLSVSRAKLRDGDTLTDGGAILGSEVTVRRSSLSGNRAVQGGAITASDLNIEKSVVGGNRAVDFAGGLSLTTVTVADTIIRNNIADEFAGGLSVSSGVTIKRSTISVKEAGWLGGGMSLSFGLNTIERSTISGNTAGTSGGGIAKSFDQLTINDSTISGNDGGGINSSFDDTRLTHVAVVGNEGGGIRNSFDQFTLADTIIAGNTGTDQCDANVTSLGFNIASDASCTLSAEGDQPETQPRLFPLANNGGPTKTHALRNGSPALNLGNPASPPGSAGCAEVDQRGAPRTGRCDVGPNERVRCKGAIVNRVGTSGRDRLRGTNGKDGLIGLGGGDKLKGRGGKDGLCGGGGRDRLDGGDARDQCDGGPGTDRARSCEVQSSIP
jgi:hypothetical protein